MSTCMNPHCGKSNLRKCDVELDDRSGMLFCLGCYCMLHPGWKPEGPVVDVLPEGPEVSFNYEVSLSNLDGLKARVGYGDVNILFHAPMEQIKRFLGQ